MSVLSSLITRPWFTEGANVWQWVTSFVAVIGWSFAAHVYWTHRCHICNWRSGHHKVEGTTYKVCHHHHMPEYHDLLRDQHGKRHPDRMAHGQS